MAYFNVERIGEGKRSPNGFWDSLWREGGGKFAQALCRRMEKEVPHLWTSVTQDIEQ